MKHHISLIHISLYHSNFQVLGEERGEKEIDEAEGMRKITGKRERKEGIRKEYSGGIKKEERKEEEGRKKEK